MTEKKTNFLNEPLNRYHFIGVLVIMAVMYVYDVASSALTNEPSERQTTQLSHGNQNDVHPSSSNIVTVGRNYIFTGGYVTSTRDELRNLDNLVGNHDALMNRVNNSPYVTTFSMPMQVTVVQRAGGVLSGEHVLIQTENGRQYWTVPEFLEPVRQ